MRDWRSTPPWLPSEEDRRAESLKVWADAVVRRELKLALRRAGIPFDPADSTLVLGTLQELAHRGLHVQA